MSDSRSGTDANRRAADEQTMKDVSHTRNDVSAGAVWERGPEDADEPTPAPADD